MKHHYHQCQPVASTAPPPPPPFPKLSPHLSNVIALTCQNHIQDTSVPKSTGFLARQNFLTKHVSTYLKAKKPTQRTLCKIDKFCFMSLTLVQSNVISAGSPLMSPQPPYKSRNWTECDLEQSSCSGHSKTHVRANLKLNCQVETGEALLPLSSKNDRPIWMILSRFTLHLRSWYW